MDYFIGIVWRLVNPQLLTRNRQIPWPNLSFFFRNIQMIMNMNIVVTYGSNMI